MNIDFYPFVNQSQSVQDFQGEMKGVIVILILLLLSFFVSFLAATHCGSVESSFIKQKYFKKFPSQGKRIHYIQETNIRL